MGNTIGRGRKPWRLLRAPLLCAGSVLIAAGCQSTQTWMPRFAKSDSSADSVETIVRSPDGKWEVETAKSSEDAAAKKKSESDDLMRQYTQAEQLFREEQYSQASTAFNRIARKQRKVKSTLREDALFMKAESLFHAGKLPAAQDTYALLLKEFPTTRHLPTAIQRTYDIAFYWLEDSRRMAEGLPTKHNAFTRFVNLTDPTRPLLDTPGRGIEAIESIQQFDPLGPITDDAVMMAGAHNYTSGKYVQAAGYFEQLVADQPKSEHAARAYMLGADAYLRAYPGPSYDGQDLTNSRRLTEAALVRGGELEGEQRQRLQHQLRFIYLETAKRQYTTAECYKQMRKLPAAKFYYERVIEEYPDTDWARSAQEEIVKIDERLAKPNYLWNAVSAPWTYLESRFAAADRPTESTLEREEDDRVGAGATIGAPAEPAVIGPTPVGGELPRLQPAPTQR